MICPAKAIAALYIRGLLPKRIARSLFYRSTLFTTCHHDAAVLHTISFGTLAMRLDLPLRYKQNWTFLFESFDGPPDGVSLRVYSLIAAVSKFIYDVGMNAGLYLYHGVASAPMDAVVVGVEPNAGLASLVRSNLTANGITNAKVETACCSDVDGLAELFTTNTDHMSSLEPDFLRASGRPLLGTHTVATLSLDTYEDGAEVEITVEAVRISDGTPIKATDSIIIVARKK